MRTKFLNKENQWGKIQSASLSPGNGIKCSPRLFSLTEIYRDLKHKHVTDFNGRDRFLSHELLMSFWMTLQNTHVHRQQTIYWIFAKKNWAVSTDINLLSLIGPWWNVKPCLQFRWNSNLQFLVISKWFFIACHVIFRSYIVNEFSDFRFFFYLFFFFIFFFFSAY